ncbi:MAG: zinc metallopeptidase, partial [Clostridiales bacterium]|nr:zinc metallopeptidase [Clostridiales bacterium]
LSEGVYNSSSVAAIGIAAHEAGLAFQKKDGYAPMAWRGLLVPVVNSGSKLSFPLILLGLIMSIEPLVTAGIVLFSLAVVFSLLTLPVELNASSRAVSMLTAGGFIDDQEKAGVKAVLRAAAFTYVAAALGAVLQLVRLILISQNNRRRN